MNPLGTIKQFEDLIHQGYGYSQLCEKMGLSEQDIKNLVAEYPSFALVLKSRYGIIIEPNKQEEQPKQVKPLKRKKKDEENNEGTTEEVVLQ